MNAYKTQCKSIQLSNKNKECCIIYSSNIIDPSSKNYMRLSNFKMSPEQIKQTKNRMVELSGFIKTNSYVYASQSPYNHTYDCPSQLYSITYDYEAFTDEE